MRQEQKNLEKYLKILSKQRQRALDLCDYQMEQTELDLEQRIKKCSTQLSELSSRTGLKEGIALARRESLGVLHLYDGRTWNMATKTYHTKGNNSSKQRLSQETNHTKGRNSSKERPSIKTSHTKSSHSSKERLSPEIRSSLMSKHAAAVRLPSIESQDGINAAVRTGKLDRSKCEDVAITSSLKLPKL
ncbi:hypothetical protein DPMN_064251 [Dreissena polymorpha]|uniref:Uncharacterized protein n=1 Tax=Dreissena polymorpha TaxID=45954 RepID=A0A9D4CCE7_DREPO|nr:hypothetical protein DPMN_064251 [Dreissena polymorpha]